MTVALLGGVLIDGNGGEPMRRAGVVLEHDRIVAAGPLDRLEVPRDAERIDLDGRTVMPGLIDCHTHLTYHVEEPDVWQLDMRESVELNTLYAARNARAILEMGFTTIGDGGCRGYIGPAIRDGVARGLIPGPRVVAAGAILSGPAGLYDFAPPWAEIHTETALSTVVSGVEAVRRAVLAQIKGGVDWIKVAASGVAGSRYSNAEQEDLSYEEMRAAVVEAARFGKRVHAHAHSREGIRAAIEAGVISLHSGEFADEEVLALMRDRGVIFSPTIAWLQARYLPVGGAPPNAEFRRQAFAAYAAAREALTVARRIGTKVAIGTDACHRFKHVPDGVLEMEYFTALGWSPMETIVAATRTAAEALGRADQLGTIERGKLADLLVVEGNAAEDIRLLRDKRHIRRLYQSGREVALPADRGVPGEAFKAADWVHVDLADVAGD